MARFAKWLASSIVLLGLLALGMPAAAQPNDTNRIHMHAKPAVVRIYAGFVGSFSNKRGETARIPIIGSGSGFIINPAGYVLTNAHVVSDIKEGDEAAKRRMYQTLVAQVLQASNMAATDDNVRRAAAALDKQGYELTGLKRINVVVLQSGKSFPFEIKAYGAPTGEGKDLESGKDVSILKIEIRNAPTMRLGVSANVNVGDHVWVMGYPGAADSEQLDAQSELEPTTNDGSISARKSTKDGTPVLQTNTNTTHGNSGGPVINAKGEVIGLLTFRGNAVNGQEVQGFNFIVPIDTASEFVRQAGTDNQQSVVDPKWVSGLDHYWVKEYSLAQKDFQEIAALFPDHREAAKLVTDCQEHIAKGEDQSNVGAGVAVLVFLIIGVVAVLGGGALVVFFLLKKKGASGQPTQGGYPMQAYPPQAAAGGYAHAHPQGAPGGYAQAPGAPGGYAQAPGAPGGYAQAPGAPGAPAPGGYAQAHGGYAPHPGQAAPAAYGHAAAPTGPNPGPGGTAARGGRTELHTSVTTIRFVAGPTSGQMIPIPPTGLVIGREPGQAQIVVQDSQVSSAHAWVATKANVLVFVDRGSTNGSMVNDRPIPPGQETPLTRGDVITLGRSGSVKFVVE